MNNDKISKHISLWKVTYNDVKYIGLIINYISFLKSIIFYINIYIYLYYISDT